MAEPQNTGAHAASKRPGGRLLWLWLLLGLIVLFVLAWVIAGALNDHELEGGLPVGTEQTAEPTGAVLVGDVDILRADSESTLTVEVGDTVSFTGISLGFPSGNASQHSHVQRSAAAGGSR